jgi:transposase-like protein
VVQHDFDPYELLDALRAGDDVDLIRQSVEMVLQALIKAEVTGVIGAGPHERTEDRQNYRNGHRPRMLSTKAGDLELSIPKLRSGSFFPQILERRRRIDRALFAVVMKAYVHGVSTRKARRASGRVGDPQLQVIPRYNANGCTASSQSLAADDGDKRGAKAVSTVEPKVLRIPGGQGTVAFGASE